MITKNDFGRFVYIWGENIPNPDEHYITFFWGNKPTEVTIKSTIHNNPVSDSGKIVTAIPVVTKDAWIALDIGWLIPIKDYEKLSGERWNIYYTFI